ncbi:MAG: PTS sugar transporter subunit IIA, partial [Pseudomonadota bacterium]
MHDLLTVDAIAPSLKATSKKQALQEVARIAAPIIGHDERLIFDVLLQRERLGTTGVGHGVAIPHGKIAGMTGVRAFFAKLARPVDFDAVDDEDVDLIFVLL